MHQDSEAPVNIGDEVTVTVEAVGAKGDGIAKVNGFVLFVPSTSAGETVKIRITKVLANVGFAEVVSRNEKKKKGESTEQEYSAPQPEPEPEPTYEDSEDFGEEETEQ
jgi:predicted RNA-binding protein with TRAM domain